jgi:hypothetical protein
MQPCCKPGALARKKPDETSAYPARSRLHGGTRQQAAAFHGLTRQSRTTVRLFLDASPNGKLGSNYFATVSSWVGAAARAELMASMTAKKSIDESREQ